MYIMARKSRRRRNSRKKVGGTHIESCDNFEGKKSKCKENFTCAVDICGNPIAKVCRGTGLGDTVKCKVGDLRGLNKDDTLKVETLIEKGNAICKDRDNQLKLEKLTRKTKMASPDGTIYALKHLDDDIRTFTKVGSSEKPTKTQYEIYDELVNKLKELIINNPSIEVNDQSIRDLNLEYTKTLNYFNTDIGEVFEKVRTQSGGKRKSIKHSKKKKSKKLRKSKKAKKSKKRKTKKN